MWRASGDPAFVRWQGGAHAEGGPATAVQHTTGECCCCGCSIKCSSAQVLTPAAAAHKAPPRAAPHHQRPWHRPTACSRLPRPPAQASVCPHPSRQRQVTHAARDALVVLRRVRRTRAVAVPQLLDQHLHLLGILHETHGKDGSSWRCVCYLYLLLQQARHEPAPGPPSHLPRCPTLTTPTPSGLPNRSSSRS